MMPQWQLAATGADGGQGGCGPKAQRENGPWLESHPDTKPNQGHFIDEGVKAQRGRATAHGHTACERDWGI